MLDESNVGPKLTVPRRADQLGHSSIRILLVDKRCGYVKEVANL